MSFPWVRTDSATALISQRDVRMDIIWKMLRSRTIDLTQIEDPSFVWVSLMIILNTFTQNFTRVGDVFAFGNTRGHLHNWHCLFYSELLNPTLLVCSLGGHPRAPTFKELGSSNSHLYKKKLNQLKINGFSWTHQKLEVAKQTSTEIWRERKILRSVYLKKKLLESYHWNGTSKW